jgi:hypothetical protein
VTFVSDLAGIVVIPAKAGYQPFRHSRESGNPGINWFARFARDLKSYLWVADPRQVTFSCLSKKKSPKRRTPRAAHRAHYARFPALLTKPGARLTRRPPTTRLGLDQKARDYPRLRCGARFATRGPKNQTVAGFCSPPVWRARASQPASGKSRASCSSPERVVCARRVGARADAGEKRRGQSRHSGVLSFRPFSLHEQRKGTRLRCGNRKYKYAAAGRSTNMP